jgi:hypothetical protein
MIQRSEYYLKNQGYSIQLLKKLKYIDSKAIHCAVLAVFLRIRKTVDAWGMP